MSVSPSNDHFRLDRSKDIELSLLNDKPSATAELSDSDQGQGAIATSEVPDSDQQTVCLPTTSLTTKDSPLLAQVVTSKGAELSLGRNAGYEPTPAELRLLTYLHHVPGRHAIRWLVMETTTGKDAVIVARKRCLDNEWLDKSGNVTDYGLRHIPPILREPWMTKRGQLRSSTLQTVLNEPWTDERAWGIRGLIVMRRAFLVDDRSLKAGKVAEWLGIDQHTASTLLGRWAKKDIVWKSGRGAYVIPANPFDGATRWDSAPAEHVLRVENRVERILAEMADHDEEKARWRIAQFGPARLQDQTLLAFEDFVWQMAR